MFWICPECGWENEYSDEVKHTVCQCCETPAPEEIIAEAVEALNRFHREEERRRQEEEIRRKAEKRQQAVNRAMSVFRKALRTLPGINIAAAVIAVAVMIGSFFVGDTSAGELWNRLGTGQLVLENLSSHFRLVKDNSETMTGFIPEALPENISSIESGAESYHYAVSDRMEEIGDKWSDHVAHTGINSNLYTDTLEAQWMQAEFNLSEVGDRISEAVSGFFGNMEYFWTEVLENVNDLHEEYIKR